MHALAPPAPDAEFDSSPDALRRLSDDDLVERLRRCAEERRRLEHREAVYAAEVSRRSRPELGPTGLAQRRGIASGAELVRRVGGVTRRDAHTLVEVGLLLASEGAADSARAAGLAYDPASAGLPDDEPWLASVTAATREARIGLDAARAIRDGLGRPDDRVDSERLGAAARRVVRLASELTIEQLAQAARLERDEIDAAGIAEREDARRERRYLRLTPAPDGLTRVDGLLDPESAAFVVGAFDRITGPRRGGPRFVDSDDAARAAALETDPRTTGQLLHDAFVQMVRLAVDADPGRLFGRWEPGVRVHVDARDLGDGRGSGRIEAAGGADEGARVSIASVRRLICAHGAVVVVRGDGGQPLDVGRDQRLFTRRQRTALAARDGGCRYPGCDRPPAWCESHHIDEWSRGGRTDVRDGVLLCRRHHLMVHNGGFRIRREGAATYWLDPPPDDPAGRAPRLLPPQRAALRAGRERDDGEPGDTGRGDGELGVTGSGDGGLGVTGPGDTGPGG